MLYASAEWNWRYGVSQSSTFIDQHCTEGTFALVIGTKNPIVSFKSSKHQQFQ